MRRCLLYTSLIALFTACILRPKLLDSGKLGKTQYCDTIRFADAFGLIAVPVSLNGQSKQLIFDTGADMIVVPKDSAAKGVSIHAKTVDSNNKTTGFNIGRSGPLTIAGLEYTDLYALHMEMPKLLACFGDGLIGNNVIPRSHWKIVSDRLIRSSGPFTPKKGSVSRPYVLRSTHRFFSSFTINGMRFDSCLIDYGGRFEIDVPMKFYSTMIKQMKTIHRTNTVVASSWGIGGKSAGDTSLVVNCDIDLSGISASHVNIRFSRSFSEKRLGALLLRRFNAVYINPDERTLTFELPLAASVSENPFSADIDAGQYRIDGYEVSKEPEFIHIGDHVNFINGKAAGYFHSFCEFRRWLQEQKLLSSINILMEDGRSIVLVNPVERR